jgi:hypothetical protein
MPARTLRERGIDFPNPDVKALVEKYDPEDSIVVFFYWQDCRGERQNGYRIAIPSFPRPKDTVWLGDVRQIMVRM